MNNIHKNANFFYKNKKYNKSIKLYFKLINNSYKNDILYSNISACYMKMNDYVNSLKYGLKSIEANLYNSVAWARIGFSYKLLKKHNEAYKAFDIAHKIDKNNKIYYKELEFYHTRYSKKVNISNIFNLIFTNKNIYDKIKETSTEIVNTKNVFNNSNIINLIDTIIKKLE